MSVAYALGLVVGVHGLVVHGISVPVRSVYICFYKKYFKVYRVYFIVLHNLGIAIHCIMKQHVHSSLEGHEQSTTLAHEKYECV